MKISRKVFYQVIFVLCTFSCLWYTTAVTIDLNDRLDVLTKEYKAFVEKSKESTGLQVERIESMNMTLEGTSKNLEMILKNNEMMQSMIMENELFNRTEKVEIKKPTPVKKVTKKPPTIKKGDIKIPSDILAASIKYSNMKSIDNKLILAILYKESTFNPKARNTIHHGLGQISEKTGKYIHEGLLRKSTPYSTDILYNVDTNVEYTVAYVSYLFKIYKGDRYKVLKHYSGSKTPSKADKYVQDIDNLIDKL